MENIAKKGAIPYVSLVAKCKNLSNLISSFYFRSPVRNQGFSCQAGQCDSWRQFQGIVTIGKILFGPLLLDLNLLKGQLDEIFDRFFLPPMTLFLLSKLFEPSVPSAYAFKRQMLSSFQRKVENTFHPYST